MVFRTKTAFPLYSASPTVDASGIRVTTVLVGAALIAGLAVGPAHASGVPAPRAGAQHRICADGSQLRAHPGRSSAQAR
ncbi:hypothetical protein BX283_0540 [Streptomyces sp. TLI_146]|nr:hypothetical protein BX283_0540 [Streptomyces sp. TLI_146]